MKKIVMLAVMLGLLSCAAPVMAEEAAAAPAAVAEAPAVQIDTDKVLAVILQKALIAAEKTGQFVVEQAPDVVRQLLLYNTLISLFWTILGFVLLVQVSFAIRTVAQSRPMMDDYELSHTVRSAACVKFGFGIARTLFGAWLGGTLFYCNFNETMKLIFAPKVWLIEYAAALLR